MNVRLLLLFITIIFSKQQCSKQIKFNEPVDVSSGTVSGVTSIDVSDLNNDGLSDVVVIEGGKHAEKPTFAWFEQKSRTVWTRHELGNGNLLDSFLGSAKCADMDNDGDADIIVTSDQHTVGPVKIMIVENPGGSEVYQKWKMHLVASLEGSHANDMRIADMDRDGKQDIIIRHKTPNLLRILFQNTGKTWELKSLDTKMPGLEGFAVGHLNNDSVPDISSSGYWFMAPAQPRKGEYISMPVDTGYTRINPNTKEAIGDINNDGRNDIIISPAESYYGGMDHVLAWYEAPELPSHVWKQHIIRNQYNRAHAVMLADMDNDGDLDIVSGQAWPPMRITVYINEEGKFSNSYIVSEGKGIYSGQVADVDNDGDLDIIGEETYSQKSRPWFYENLVVTKPN